MTLLSASFKQPLTKHKWYTMRSLQAVETDAIAGDELWSFVEKNKNTAYPKS
jgi:hypothetical protein